MSAVPSSSTASMPVLVELSTPAPGIEETTHQSSASVNCSQLPVLVGTTVDHTQSQTAVPAVLGTSNTAADHTAFIPPPLSPPYTRSRARSHSHSRLGTATELAPTCTAAVPLLSTATASHTSIDVLTPLTSMSCQITVPDVRA